MFSQMNINFFHVIQVIYFALLASNFDFIKDLFYESGFVEKFEKTL